MKPHFKIYTVECDGDDETFKGIVNNVEDINVFYTRAIKDGVARFIIRDHLGGTHLNRDMTLVLN